jgi:uncharacterized UBP type Zn finger protein
MPDPCTHIEQVRTRHAVKPSAQGCQECLASGDSWVHLRVCLACGHVGCCDSSPNRHATRHFHQTHHPVIRSYEPGEDWAYCYVDEQFVETLPALPGEAAARHYGTR